MTFLKICVLAKNVNPQVMYHRYILIVNFVNEFKFIIIGKI